jgi:hypothetical protein
MKLNKNGFDHLVGSINAIFGGNRNFNFNFKIERSSAVNSLA